MIVLLISLGSSICLFASPPGNGPYFDIFRSFVSSTYSLSDHLSAQVDPSGAIRLKLSNPTFEVIRNKKAIEVQQNEPYTNLSNSQWTKEWKASDLPIFCKAEHHIQKKSGIAFRFRLGSLDYVNALEGK